MRLPGQSLPILASAGAVHLLLLSWPMFLIRDVGSAAENHSLLLFLLMASIWFFAEGVASIYETRRPTATSNKSWLEIKIGLATLVTFWICVVDVSAAGPSEPGLAAAAGVTVMAMGVFSRYLSMRTLGRFFLNEVAVVPGQPLVTHGIYRVVRHPSEAGTLSLAFGATVLCQSMFGIAVFLVLLLPAVMRRIRLEDEVLRSHHPVAFARYARAVGALIPRPGH